MRKGASTHFKLQENKIIMIFGIHKWYFYRHPKYLIVRNTTLLERGDHRVLEPPERSFQNARSSLRKKKNF